MFYWWGFEEEAVHAELKRLRIPADRVEWQERYYDRTFDFNDPRSCRTRPFIPQNVKDDPPETESAGGVEQGLSNHQPALDTRRVSGWSPSAC